MGVSELHGTVERWNGLRAQAWHGVEDGGVRSCAAEHGGTSQLGDAQDVDEREAQLRQRGVEERRERGASEEAEAEGGEWQLMRDERG